MAKGVKTGGRQKGSINKTTATVKAALSAVYAKRGGDKALKTWADANETEFYKLWGRMLPQEVSGPDGGPISFAGIDREIIRAKDTSPNR